MTALQWRAPIIHRVHLVDRTKLAIANGALRVASRLHSRVYIGLDYPPNTDNAPRYTHDQPHGPLHAAFARDEARYRRTLQQIRRYDSDLCALPVRATEAGQPSLVNGFLPGLDSAALYAFIRDRRPRRYIEVGSGNSTKFAARAKADGALATAITSIDPRPRAEIDELCDAVLRTRLERLPPDVFGDLEPGDVVFFDGSHSVYMGNDVAVFFLEVLPELPPGILVGIHDIYLPFDYPPMFAERFYTEQYMLAAYLLAAPPVRVILPAQYVMASPDLRALVERMWDQPHLHEVEHHGAAFWMETT